MLSPVEASARYLGYLAEAWQHKSGTPLGEHDVVLTVPASFDEEARELTVQAAREAGIERLTLLEEPAAAFYAWIAGHLARSNKELFDGQLVLVCDVGGGTSDFTLVRVQREGDKVEFTRTNVGRHLLLGGDNLDLTISWLAESKAGRTLSLRQRSGLRRQCSSAKETLLSPNAPPSVAVTVTGAGTSLIGGTLKTEITRDEVLELALGGFLPPCELSDTPQQEKQSVFRELGLPYVSDPAITRHLAEFLRGTPAAERGIDAILFNGGFFIPEVLRDRVRDVVTHWFGRAPIVFENQDLDLAVAIGASYYSYVRATGAGVVVRGGLPRAYFIGVESVASSSSIQTVCLMPRGTEEGQEIRLDQPELQLLANTPVAFRLYSSLSRRKTKQAILFRSIHPATCLILQATRACICLCALLSALVKAASGTFQSLSAPASAKSVRSKPGPNRRSRSIDGVSSFNCARLALNKRERRRESARPRWSVPKRRLKRPR